MLQGVASLQHGRRTGRCLVRYRRRLTRGVLLPRQPRRQADAEADSVPDQRRHQAEDARRCIVRLGGERSDIAPVHVGSPPVCQGIGHRPSRGWRPLPKRADTTRIAGGCERHVCKAGRQWATLTACSLGHAESGVSQPTWNAFMKAINVITLVLLIVGGLNWGLVGLFQFDLVAALFGGQDALLSRVVYTLVGLSALWQLVPLFRNNHGTAGHHTSPHVRNNP